MTGLLLPSVTRVASLTEFIQTLTRSTAESFSVESLPPSLCFATLGLFCSVSLPLESRPLLSLVDWSLGLPGGGDSEARAAGGGDLALKLTGGRLHGKDTTVKDHAVDKVTDWIESVSNANLVTEGSTSPVKVSHDPGLFTSIEGTPAKSLPVSGYMQSPIISSKSGKSSK